MLEAFEAAAMHVDHKWSGVFEAQDELRQFIASRIQCGPSEIAFAASTHELVTRFVSALALKTRPHVVTTSGEFHSAFRQLKRLSEEGVRVSWVDPHPTSTLAERLAREVSDQTAAVIVSNVMFESSAVVPHLESLTEHATHKGAYTLIDAYHAFNVVPFATPKEAFVVGGGYKYAQWGEGVCFLRVPANCTLRPVYTGWFAGYGELAHRRSVNGAVTYADDGATRFAGSTFEPASFFRARAVARFFDERGLGLSALREISLMQTARIIRHARSIAGVTLVTPDPDHESAESRGGFVALRMHRAQDVCARLYREGIFTDARGDILRLGPAPYVTDDEIDEALATLQSIAREA